jgi:hypothetical protein
MANSTGEVQTTVVKGTADDVNAQIAAIEGDGGAVVSVQLTAPSNGGGSRWRSPTHRGWGPGPTIEPCDERDALPFGAGRLLFRGPWGPSSRRLGGVAQRKIIETF